MEPFTYTMRLSFPTATEKEALERVRECRERLRQAGATSRLVRTASHRAAAFTLTLTGPPNVLIQFVDLIRSVQLDVSMAFALKSQGISKDVIELLLQETHGGQSLIESLLRSKGHIK